MNRFSFPAVRANTPVNRTPGKRGASEHTASRGRRLPLLLLLAAAPVIAATMPAVTMQVVDEHDGTPIPGLVAMFWGTARQGTFTGHGGRHAILFAVEAVSDESGVLRFPKQDFNSQPFFLNTNYENPSMLLLKPGYAPLVLHK